jgi:hypothetical protein
MSGESESLTDLSISLCSLKNSYVCLLFHPYISALNKVDSYHLDEQKMDEARIDVTSDVKMRKTRFMSFFLRILQNESLAVEPRSFRLFVNIIYL